MTSKLPGRRSRRPAANAPSLEALLSQMDAEAAEAGEAAAAGETRPVMTSGATLGDADAYRRWQARQAPGCPSKAKAWPSYSAWPLSFLTFMWFDPLMQLGLRDQLQPADIWEIAERDKSVVVHAAFEQRWCAECARAARAGEDPQLWRAMAHCMKWHLAAAAGLRCTADMMDFVRPLIMQQILLVIEGNGDQLAWWAPPPERVWLLAFALFGGAMTWTFCNVHYNFLVMNKSIRTRSAIIGCLFRKSIGLSPGVKAAYSSGKITNLMSNDADKLILCGFQVPWLWQVPINFCVGEPAATPPPTRVSCVNRRPALFAASALVIRPPRLPRPQCSCRASISAGRCLQHPPWSSGCSVVPDLSGWAR
eukprot:SAG22_NODE_44_length_24912_cov_33.648894_26_plen_365_part_00